MTRFAEDSTGATSAPVRRLLRSANVQQEMALYVLVSALDVFMTYILLSREGSVFVESNPVARYFINGWGTKGMVYFKFGTVALVCVLAHVIAQRRPRVAQYLLRGAIALVAIVVIYSLKLLLVHGNPLPVDFD